MVYQESVAITVTHEMYRSGFNKPLLSIEPECTIAYGELDQRNHKIFLGGHPLPNANVTKISPVDGGYTWELAGVTEDWQDIIYFKSMSGPLTSGFTVLGKQFVSSEKLPQIFEIFDTSGGFDSYENCYLISPIEVTPFDVYWFYVLKVVQSYE